MLEDAIQLILARESCEERITIESDISCSSVDYA